jgi:glutathione S-transferase
MSKRAASDEFDGPDATEKAAIEAALNRCRVVAGQIESILRNERRHFVDKVLLADFYAALERAADVLGQKRRQPVDNTPAPAVKGLQARGRQRHR